MDTECFVYEIETEDYYKDIAKNVAARFHTIRYLKEDNRPIPILIGKNKKAIGMVRDEFGGNIKIGFDAQRAKLSVHRRIETNIRLALV